MVIDFHCHIDLYAQPDRIAQRIHDNGLGALSMTTTPSAWQGTSRLAQGRSGIRTALGLHPQLARQRRRELPLFSSLLDETDFVGEIGLDGGPEFADQWLDQLDVFRTILHECERAGGRVLSIHSRRAVPQVLEQLADFPRAGTPILHWFAGTQALRDAAVRAGCWFSVGPAMLAGAKGRALIAGMPRDRVVLESDGPFAQAGGLPIGPWNLAESVGDLAQAWGVTLDEANAQIRRNELWLAQASTSRSFDHGTLTRD